jgi:hypothetical protein
MTVFVWFIVLLLVIFCIGCIGCLSNNFSIIAFNSLFSSSRFLSFSCSITFGFHDISVIFVTVLNKPVVEFTKYLIFMSFNSFFSFG